MVIDGWDGSMDLRSSPPAWLGISPTQYTVHARIAAAGALETMNQLAPLLTTTLILHLHHHQLMGWLP